MYVNNRSNSWVNNSMLHIRPVSNKLHSTCAAVCEVLYVALRYSLVAMYICVQPITC